MMNVTELIYVKHQKGVRAIAMPERRIPYVELTVVFKGRLDYTVDGQSVPLGEGDTILIPQGHLRARRQGEADAEYFSFNFVATDLPELPILLKGALSGEIRLLLASADELQKTQIPHEKEPLAHLICSLCLVLKNNLARSGTHPLMLQILRYLHAHIAEHITLADIARETFFSAVYCDAVFKKETGHSIIDYLLRERIALACRLLAEGTLSLRAVAEAVGFPDYNYFARTFKKRTGHTPGNYRKLLFPTSSS